MPTIMAASPFPDDDLDLDFDLTIEEPEEFLPIPAGSWDEWERPDDGPGLDPFAFFGTF